ncbi:MAG: hypothetical protein LBE49_08100 [Deltaproteobacteria bacterium]|jgi:hypothetical protein|nr:hypothetical protein [Deltaproteobacteria bacterium]
MLSKMIKILVLIVALTMAAVGQAPADEDLSAPLVFEGAYNPDSLPAPREAPTPFSNKPKTLDFLMRDLTPLPQGEAETARTNYYLSVSRVYDLGSSLGSAASPAIPSPFAGASEFDETTVRTGIETSALFFDQRLALSGGVSWDQSIYNPYWSNGGDPSGEVSTMTYGFGADLAINDEWTAAAALTKRESVSRPGRRVRHFSEPAGLIASDLAMGRLGVQFLKPDWDLRARFSVYAGRIGQAHFDRDSGAGLADLKGLEISLQKKLLDGRLSLELAAMLNSLTTRHALQLASMNGGNLSAFLGLTYTDPAFLNASIFLRHAQDGNYITSYFLGAMGATSMWDARIWRDFSLSPNLNLSTQIYGSSLIEAYFENLTEGARSSTPYVEGRVTMSYSF